MIKLLTWLILIIILFTTLFHVFGAQLSSEVVLLSIMLLLLSLFSELKEFNFWGLKGKKIEKELKQLEGKKAIKKKKESKKTRLTKGEEQTRLERGSVDKSSFLEYSYEVERLLRIYATENLKQDIPSNVNPKVLTDMLFENDLLTKEGVKQLETMRWLRNLLIHGRESEITYTTLEMGLHIAASLYDELYLSLYQTKK